MLGQDLDKGRKRRICATSQSNTPTGLIAYKLGRSEVAVRSKAGDLGVSLNPPNRCPYGRTKR